MGGDQINRAFDQINKKMLQSRLMPVPVRIARRILLKIALKMIWPNWILGKEKLPRRMRSLERCRGII
jgi:hypothetical protein